ncbi:MAG: alanine racemase, partial [Gemmatimonadota bacterium]|nr:alanine racemase [Gemmatimonadota bacterium]
DAYGLGVLPCARALRAVGPWGFGVATLDEAADLREWGFHEPILVFTPVALADLPRVRDVGVRAVVDQPVVAQRWDRPFHLEIDTGMSRCGVRWDDSDALAAMRSPHLEGVFTHLHSADTQPVSVTEQWERFSSARALLGEGPTLVHVANSAGTWRLPEPLDLVRPGIFLYGGELAPDLPAPAPVVSLRAPVVSLRRLRAGDTVSYGADWMAPRDTTVATLGIGYADGIPRAAQNRAYVILADRRMPIVGRVTMDFVMVDVGPDHAGVGIGEVATLIGTDGGHTISLDEFAAWAGTISYEVIARLGPRLARRYRTA